MLNSCLPKSLKNGKSYIRTQYNKISENNTTESQYDVKESNSAPQVVIFTREQLD